MMSGNPGEGGLKAGSTRLLTAAGAVVMLLAAPAGASTGSMDSAGQFPAVGAFYELTIDDAGGIVWAEQSCTSTLIAADLVISAAHCAAYYLEHDGVSGYSNEAWVSFDLIASRNDFHCFLRDNGLDGRVGGPSDNSAADQLPCHRDGAGNPLENEPGIPPHPVPTFRKVMTTGYFAGVPVAHGVSHPEYLNDSMHPDGTIRRRVHNLASLPDLTVLILETPVSTPAPLPLAALGYLDGIAALTQAPVLGVGYGLNWGKVPGTQPTGNGSGPLQVISGSGIRRIAAIGSVQNLHQHAFIPSQRPNQGDDTVCYGDSGSPAFLDADHNGQIEPVITGILSGWTNWCQGSHDPYSRIDTPQADEFLDCVLSAPSASAVRACGAEAAIDALDATP